MKKGTVKFFNETKGFGFIIENETNESHFVHISGLIHKVSEGDLVEYNLEEGKKGMNAVEVRLIEH
tara:strand:+ start:337 stop:534 length:198 start_codon:yes stop_codon:yes gene_type:complete